jgi:hypothetical protein
VSDLYTHRTEREWDALPAMAKAYFAGKRAEKWWQEIELANAALLHAEAERDRWLAKALTAGIASWELEYGTLTLEVATGNGEPRGTLHYRPRPDTPYWIRLKEAGQ